MTIKSALKIGCVLALLVLAFFGLGPAHLQPRTGLGWQIDHFVGYIALACLFCIAWPWPLRVGGALVVFAGVLEAAQALTTDRSSNAVAFLYSACGVIAGVLIAEASMRIWRRLQSKRAEARKF